ncbi:MAG: MBL fold metallo-hydrolase RNA specificity domain-containing protein [Planctomycetota bacterium]|jgi:metallo-beta-lactamase family protein
MEITFLGAARTVTGSRFLVRAGGTRVLIDCGLFQGFREARRKNWDPFAVPPDRIDAVILTHAHIDHSGYLPLLVKRGFTGPIYCTVPTRDLCSIMLPDSGRIHEEDARYANEKGYSRHHPALPLYTEKDGKAVIPQMHVVPFGLDQRIGELEFHFAEAGHILGAAGAHVRNGKRSIYFSGDIGRYADPIMRPPTAPEPADYIVMESTYGDRRHADLDVVEALEEVAGRTFERGGMLLIPSFAVGRAQTIMYCLDEMFRRGKVGRVPVYLDSPMATDATAIYDKHVDYHKLSADDVERVGRSVVFVRTPDESRALNFKPGPMVIISASGMLTGGRVLHHLKERAPVRSNTILLPGYQAPGTRGARLARGEPKIKVHGMYVDVEADVVQLDAFSAHAGQRELMEWIGHADGEQRKVFLVHGEVESAETLATLIRRRLRFEVVVPGHGDAFDLR